MNLLTEATTTLLGGLIDWDRARVASLEARGLDCSAYRARQEAAYVALGTPPVAWPREVREVYQALIEVRYFDPSEISRRELFRDAAIEIGVDGPLREAAPALFA